MLVISAGVAVIVKVPDIFAYPYSSMVMENGSVSATDGGVKKEYKLMMIV